MIEQVPLIDFKSNYFKHSYEKNIMRNQKECILVKKMIQSQIATESLET